jgi:hypothetical protein
MSTERPTVETLFRQASMTASTYFHEAIEAIDKHFGEGYAQKHPELVGAFMQTSALDFQAGFVGTAIKEAVETIAVGIENLEKRKRSQSCL